MISHIKKHLEELGFKENEIKVYVALTEMGESVASRIAKRSNLPRTTVISILEKLHEHHYVSAHKYRNTTYYWIESPKTLESIFENRIKIAQELGALLVDLYRSEADFPSAQIFDSKTTIKNYIEKLLVGMKKKSIIYTIDTPSAGNYNKIYSKEFEKILSGIKNKKGIVTKTLIPRDAFRGINPEKTSSQSIIIREMPASIKFQASLWIIGDQVVHFSGKYPFIVVIRHKLITDGIKSIFEFIWGQSQSMN